MNSFNSINSVSATTTKVSKLLENVASTCDALLGALELTSESTSQYGGGIVQNLNTEYVDQVIAVLIKLRLYTRRLQLEIGNGLIKNIQDIELFVQGMQDFSDKLHLLMRENGALRNNFEYGLREIDQAIQSILGEISIN